MVLAWRPSSSQVDADSRWLPSGTHRPGPFLMSLHQRAKKETKIKGFVRRLWCGWQTAALLIPAVIKSSLVRTISNTGFFSRDQQHVNSKHTHTASCIFLSLCRSSIFFFFSLSPPFLPYLLFLRCFLVCASVFVTAWIVAGVIDNNNEP